MLIMRGKALLVLSWNLEFLIGTIILLLDFAFVNLLKIHFWFSVLFIGVAVNEFKGFFDLLFREFFDKFKGSFELLFKELFDTMYIHITWYLQSGWSQCFVFGNLSIPYVYKEIDL